MEKNENPEELVPLTSKESKIFKIDLLANVYNETNTKLQIYQRGKCLKTSGGTKLRKPSLVGVVGKDPMPSEKILNDIKLDKELDALRNVYEVAFKELTAQIACLETTEEELVNPHDKLIATIESLKPENNKFDIAQRELKENRVTVKKLKEELKSEKVKSEQDILERSQRLQELKEQMQNTKRINALECRLVEKWEANRLSQARIMGEIAERSLMKQICELHRKMAGEQRLICEVESFRKNQIADIQQQIRDWEQKFKDEKAKMLKKILDLSENIADLQKSHEKHLEINKTQNEFVDQYKKQKAEERRLFEEQMFRVECAVRIQAWWRGTMVRRGLGPYRKKSKKSKKAKGKK